MNNNVSIYFIFLFSCIVFAQDELESLLGPINENDTVINTFKSTRIINNHSIEIFDTGQLDLRISHRFGLLNTGPYELFGLDQAKIRIGFEYGLINNMMIGLGRSTYNKTYDGYIKYVFKEQTNGTKKKPFSLVGLSSFSINSLKKSQHDYPFLGRLSFTNQLMIASKINREFSIQIMPTFVHWNMVKENTMSNNISVLGVGFRYLISKSVSINSEYFFRFIDSTEDDYYNSFSIGLDIETGGHVFQLHLTNSMSMDEAGFMTRTQNSWKNGGIHFGFNISREFNL